MAHFLKTTAPMSAVEAGTIKDVWSLEISSRSRLYMFWLENYRSRCMKECCKLQIQFRHDLNELREIREQEDIYICKRAYIVGMTTCGASKYRNVLKNLNPKVVVVEEAAEILESHIVTSLAAGTKHVILIGDHQQLRPSPTVHDLAVKYNLNVSLFERMVVNGVECHQLSIQHRMRPEISALLVPHIYANLKDDESVTKYESINGVSKNVFFITHSFEENYEKDSKSKFNDHEAGFLFQLCKYLILQGYDKSQITVLTTYSAQLFALRKLLRNSILERVKCTVVDNYQGEENDIILISFVRSNDEGAIGFLKTANRVCVALSRAKKALYCIGNFELLASKCDLWENIVNKLKEKNMFGSSLQLMCQNHPEVSSVVANEKDFDLVPEGGCTRNCDYRLPCGHVCQKMCHPYDKEHLKIQCQKQCSKQCEYGHLCERKCFQKCPPCKFLIIKQLCLCHHQIEIECCLRNENIICNKPCEKRLACGHPCSKKCGDLCTLICEKRVQVFSPICGHKVNVPCHKINDTDFLAKNCIKKCDCLLSCDHVCPGTCSKCYQGRLHVRCNQSCRRILVCGHECQSKCSKSCPPCKKPCENRCSHSKCPKLCGEPCDTCTEQCDWSCEHEKCNTLCGEQCDRTPCTQPCSKLLQCEHTCIGLCGEPCPEQCRICNEDIVKTIFFGSEDEDGARFICLEDCKHIFEVDGITQWMMQNNSSNDEIQMKCCPSCKTIVRRNLYFGNIVKSCIAGIEKVKKVTFGDKKKNLNIQHSLLKKIKPSFKIYNLSFIQPLVKTLSSDKLRSREELSIMENIINIVEGLCSAWHSFSIYGEFTNSDVKKCVAEIFNFAKTAIHLIFDFIRDEFLSASEQQLNELSWEIHRLKLTGKLLLFVNKYSMLHSNIHLDIMKDCIVNYAPFQEEEATKFTDEFEKLMNTLGETVINVSKMEKKEILIAMGLSRGHWYQCPNGHVYCITECGGAMQQSTCNECGAPIGGLNHNLISTNQVATAMEGAQHSAWSEAMNMQNFGL